MILFRDHFFSFSGLLLFAFELNIKVCAYSSNASKLVHIGPVFGSVRNWWRVIYEIETLSLSFYQQRESIHSYESAPADTTRG